MITKTAMVLGSVLATAAPVLVPSTASAQVAPVQTACAWAQLEDGTWICTSDTPQTYIYDDTPYAYYYVPNIGWGWHVSPWGFGHPWRGRWNASYGHYTPRYYGGHYNGAAHVAPHYYGGQHVVHYGGGAHYGGAHGGGAHFSGGHAGGGGHGGGGHR